MLLQGRCNVGNYCDHEGGVHFSHTDHKIRERSMVFQELMPLFFLQDSRGFLLVLFEIKLHLAVIIKAVFLLVLDSVKKTHDISLLSL